jgi:Ca2+/Na+ antiporter
VFYPGYVSDAENAALMKHCKLFLHPAVFEGFGIPPLIIGMTVVSIGTSLPEVIVSLAASLHEQRDLAVGTALGSNIINILLIR